MRGAAVKSQKDEKKTADGKKIIDKTPFTNQLWKKNNVKAQKNGTHGTIYWVKQQQKYEDGSFKGEKWVTAFKYVGDWKDNNKNGFGIQYFGNGDKYEGNWELNMRNGQGTMWISEGKKKLRREYTGDWVNDKKTGRGTMFYKNGDRYDGLWLDDKAHGEGRMIYENGDVYEGFWFMGQRSGYGILTRRNGDHFEGHWVNDKREGQGSYFFATKNQVFVGEWVDDMPKAGVYSEVDDPDNPKPEREQKFTDPYLLPDFPAIELKDPTNVLQAAMEKVKRDRTFYRARFIPLDELYNKEELQDLIRDFSTGSNEKGFINMVNLIAALASMNFELLSEDEIDSYLKKLNDSYNPEEIDFQLFARLVAILLEEINNLQVNKPSFKEEKKEEEEVLTENLQHEEQEDFGKEEYKRETYEDEGQNYEDQEEQENEGEGEAEGEGDMFGEGEEEDY